MYFKSTLPFYTFSLTKWYTSTCLGLVWKIIFFIYVYSWLVVTIQLNRIIYQLTYILYKLHQPQALLCCWSCYYIFSFCTWQRYWQLSFATQKKYYCSKIEYITCNRSPYIMIISIVCIIISCYFYCFSTLVKKIIVNYSFDVSQNLLQILQMWLIRTLHKSTDDLKYIWYIRSSQSEID